MQVIQSEKLNKNNPCFIIAEIGVNHNGSILLAKELIDAAAKAGANAVKFQSFKAENIVTKTAKTASYQKRNLNNSTSQYEMLKKLELKDEDFIDLKRYSEKKKVEFLSSAFDIYSIDFLHSLGIKKFKVPSGEITNLPYLKYLAGKKRPIILSTGMSTMIEVEVAVKTIFKEGNKNVILLHCVTEYPAPHDEINLKAMTSMKEKFNLPVGYSDHTIGNEIAIAAVALGAKCIEKHFTLDKNLPGPDHKASAEPDEFKSMVTAIRNIESALGDGIKKPAKCELKNIPIVRKSIVAARYIKKNEIFTEENLTVKRPGTGISPMLFYKILGKKAKKNFQPDQLIEL